MHPQIGEIVDGIVKQRRFVYLCTNALLFKKGMKVIKPSRYFAFVVHMDGLRETHDIAVEREGVYDVAIKFIGQARKAGYRVCTTPPFLVAMSQRSITGCSLCSTTWV